MLRPFQYYSMVTSPRLMKYLEKKLDGSYQGSLEQVLEPPPYKTAVVQPLTSYLTNHPSKMNKICCALPEK